MQNTPTIEQVCQRVAELAKVPTANRHWYERTIADLIKSGIKNAASERAGKALYKDVKNNRRALTRIAKAAKLLAEALEKSTDGANNTLFLAFVNWHLDRKQMPYNESAPLFRTFLETLSAARPISEKSLLPNLGPFVSAAATRKLARKKSLRGAPAGTRNGAATEFTHLLLIWTYRAGGDLTLNATDQTGSLLAALDCCRQVMPAPFRFLSPSSIRNLYTARAKERATVRASGQKAAG